MGEKHWHENLPPEAKNWKDWETSLFVRSGGKYHPDEMTKFRHEAPKPGDPPRVSIIVPTTDARRNFHGQLMECFGAQTWPNKEIIIVETSYCGPSHYLMGLAFEFPQAVTYIHIQTHLTIGLKRNMCLHLSTGDYILHFDDDDLYAPEYV